MNKNLAIALRASGVSIGAGVGLQTVAQQKFELGYFLDTTAALATIPVSAGLGAVAGVMAGAVVGKLVDFTVHGPKAFNFRNFSRTFEDAVFNDSFLWEDEESLRHRATIVGTEYGFPVGMFIGAIGGVVGSCVVGKGLYDWRHQTFGDNKEKVFRMEKPPVDLMTQSAEEIVATKPNTITWDQVVAMNKAAPVPAF